MKNLKSWSRSFTRLWRVQDDNLRLDIIRKLSNNSGQIMVIVFAALGIVLLSVLLIIAGAQVYFQSSHYSIEAEKATALAEAGIDKAITSFNKLGDNYTGESRQPLGEGEYTVVIKPGPNTGTKIIESTGYLPNQDKPKVKRTVTIQASKGTGISFVYGVQVGEGGLTMAGGNTIDGSIYSNGSIIASGTGDENEVLGDVWVAAGQQPTPDQQPPDCEGSNCNNYIFGKTVNGENRLDVAQSFQPQTDGTLNKISLKLKKNNNPSDATVRILTDNNGSPNKNGILATGTLYAALVVTDFYGDIDITFDNTPNLTADTTYWMMVDTCEDKTNCNSSDYWYWQLNTGSSYNRGGAKWSPDWSTGNPTWNSLPASSDLAFKTYMGGVTNVLDGGGRVNIKKRADSSGGNAYANTIKNITIATAAYYQAISDATVAGSSCTLNPNCHPGSTDPPPKVFPISDANISQWQIEAATYGDILAPDCNTATPWGPGKYSGDITLGNGCQETKIISPIWIDGKLTAGNDTIFRLDSSYGSNSGMIIVKQLDFQNNNHIEGTGIGDSILMILATYDSTQDGVIAINIKNNGNTGVFYANKGIISPGLNNDFTELTAWKISLIQNSTITYKTGLSSTLFQSGPQGSYTLVKGTYQVK